MAGPIVGGSANIERLNNNSKSVTFEFAITTANAALPSAFTVVSPLAAGEAGLVLADGAGTILTGVTFSGVTRSGSAGASIVGIEIKDATAKKFRSASGLVVATSSGPTIGSTVFAKASDGYAVPTSGVVGIAFNLHFNVDIGTGTGSCSIIVTAVWE